MSNDQRGRETIFLIFMIIAVLFGIVFFIYKAWGPKKENLGSIAITETNSEKNNSKTITAEELKSKLNKKEDFILLDIREQENFTIKHIPGAINIPNDKLIKRKNELSKDKEIVVMGAGEKVDKCSLCSKAAETLTSLGFDIKHYKDGLAGWEETGLPTISGNIVNYNNINAEKLKQKIDDKENIMIIDIRNKEEYDQGHIKNAVFVPFEGISAKVNELPWDKEVVFYDKTGERSKLAVEQMVKKGMILAENLIDGFNAWTEKGYPVE